MKRAFLCLLPLLLASPAIAAQPASGLAIAAVVGDEAISSYDVDARLRFIAVTTSLSDTANIRPQVIRSLIDERLQIREAANQNITITDQDIEQSIAAIEQQRGMAKGGIAKMLQTNRVPQDTFTQQIRAQLSWNKVLIKKIRPTVKISDAEVALAQKKLSIPAVKQELEIAVLTLPVDKPQKEGEMRTLASKLYGEMQRGASFEELSRQFSSSAANAGGQVQTFWVRPEQLHPVVGKALMYAKKGSITPPLRSPDGFTIVKVYNTRALPDQAEADVEFQVKNILLKLKPDAENKEAEVLLAIGEAVVKHPGTCEENGLAGLDDIADVDIEVTRSNELRSQLTPAIRSILDGVKMGGMSAPFATEDGIRLYMLCGKRDASPATIDTDRVKEILFKEKMDLEAQKYLRNLRRDVFIEVRA